MTRWLPVILEGVRRALPWILERLKGNGADTLPAVRHLQDKARRIEVGVDGLHEKFDVQEKHLAHFYSELGKIKNRLDELET